MRPAIRLVVSIIALGLTTPVGVAQGQVFTDPPPPLMGQQSFYLYSVPGVVSVGGLTTMFACTNTTSASIRVGLEIFGDAGGAAYNDPSATSLDINAGGTVRFAMRPALGFGFSGDLIAGGVNAGSARILATAKSGIICSAFIADAGNAPPTSMAKLTVVKATKQRGE